jgi:predicted nucleotidyltransferase
LLSGGPSLFFLRLGTVELATERKLRRLRKRAHEKSEKAVLPLIGDRRAEIAALCRRFGVRRLTVFGSAARTTDFDPQRSDIDFVVVFERDGPSLSEFLALRDALSATLGRPVDLVMDGSLRNPFVRAGIQRSAEIVYGS